MDKGELEFSNIKDLSTQWFYRAYTLNLLVTDVGLRGTLTYGTSAFGALRW